MLLINTLGDGCNDNVRKISLHLAVSILKISLQKTVHKNPFYFLIIKECCPHFRLRDPIIEVGVKNKKLFETSRIEVSSFCLANKMQLGEQENED